MNDKQVYYVSGVIFVILVLLLIITVNNLVQDTKADFNAFEKECKKRGIECKWNYFAFDQIQCYDDCNEFQMKYYKVTDEGWSADNNCWCIENNKPTQIW